MAEDMEFVVLVSLLNQIQMMEESQRCSSVLQFLNDHCTPSNYFAVLRLVIPELDRERGGYGLTKSKMASCLLKILDIATDNPNAVQLTNWNKNDGRFSSLAGQLIVQSRTQGSSTSGLTVKTLNENLDLLAHSADKQARLSTLIGELRHEEIQWVIAIIVKASDQFAPFNINEEPRFFSPGSMKLQSFLRKRQDDVMLACKFTVHPQLKTDTSVKLDLTLEQMVFKCSISSVSHVYTIYDGDKGTFDVWVCERDQPNVSSALWTSLITTRVQTRYAASSFSEDNCLICTVLSKGVRTLQLSNPPNLFRLHAYFFKHHVAGEDFPHTVTITSSDLTSENVTQVRVLDKKNSNKTVKGFFFIFGKIIGNGAADMTPTYFKNQVMLPSCLVEGIKRLYAIDYIPEPMNLLIQMVEKDTAAGSEEKIYIQDSCAAAMLELDPYLVLESLGCCFPWIEELKIERFLEKACYQLARYIEEYAGNVADPVTEVYDMFHAP
ncbi:unnamed protein product [Brassica oleracea]